MMSTNRSSSNVEESPAEMRGHSSSTTASRDPVKWSFSRWLRRFCRANPLFWSPWIESVGQRIFEICPHWLKNHVATVYHWNTVTAFRRIRLASASPSNMSKWIAQFWHLYPRVYNATLQIRQSLQSTPTDVAKEAFDRAQAGQSDVGVYRTPRYDVYVPQCKTSREPLCQGILLFPGAGVDHTAYSRVAMELAAGAESACRYVVVVPSGRQSLNLVLVENGWNVRRIQQVCLQVQRNEFLDYAREPQDKRNRQNQTRITVQKWFLMGHSLGAFIACRLCLELGTLQQQEQDLREVQQRRDAARLEQHGSISPFGGRRCLACFQWSSRPTDEMLAVNIATDRIVMWGVAPFVDFVPLLPLPALSLPRILMLQAANDQLRQWMIQSNPDVLNEFYSRLNQVASDVKEEFLPLETSSHDGFADYTLANTAPPVEGKRAPTTADCVSAEDGLEQMKTTAHLNELQQRGAVDRTIRFLFPC
jgi:hypothetical protein